MTLLHQEVEEFLELLMRQTMIMSEYHSEIDELLCQWFHLFIQPHLATDVQYNLSK